MSCQADENGENGRSVIGDADVMEMERLSARKVTGRERGEGGGRRDMEMGSTFVTVDMLKDSFFLFHERVYIFLVS